MRQFTPWINVMEQEVKKVDEEPLMVTKVEYRVSDRLEKSINTQTYKVKASVSKHYFDRKKNFKPFGIGHDFKDLKTNSAITTVQRENVWLPFYETLIDDMDLKEKMLALAEEKKLANLGGNALNDLQKKLKDHDESVRAQAQETKRAELGLAPKRKFDIKEKMK
jgi:hypothetical protein